MDSPEKYYRHWELITSKGRQYWQFNLPESFSDPDHDNPDWESPEKKHYLEQMAAAFRFDKSTNANSSDRVYRTQKESSTYVHDEINPPPQLKSALEKKAFEALFSGFNYYEKLQTADGNWPGDYGGPMFLLPGLIVVAYITDTAFEPPVQVLMRQYMLNHQRDDGGWGLHIEDSSTMFGTVMQYVALRLLGCERDEPYMKKARDWIIRHGGATGISPWGKFYLSVLGCYAWQGNDSLIPELWLLPKWLPFHPSRYWNHTRMVYLPMSYCYAMRLTCENRPLITSLKEELYTVPYEQVDWKKARRQIAASDNYRPATKLFKVFGTIGNFYEKIHSKSLRKKAVRFIMEYIDAEDCDTNYINLGPVNQVINSLCVWHHHGSESQPFKQHVNRWKDYLWLAEDGMKMNGYNGSQLWDTAFAGQALLEAGMHRHFPDMAANIYQYIDMTQVMKNPEQGDKQFRTPPRGGWPFSTAEHGWPISDCTAEALKTAIQLSKTKTIHNAGHQVIAKQRMNEAVDYLLGMQNKNGGWASYEEIRGPAWLEKLNPSRLFGNIITEYAYTECTSATIQGLLHFQSEYPDYKAREINEAVKNGKHFIKNTQLSDGSWYGSWAVCFTYATWFGVESLLACSEEGYISDQVSPSIKKACEFLVGKQRADGSWGESYTSCIEKEYIEHRDGQVVNTAWALMALMAAGYPDKKVVEKGIDFLIKMQSENGDWPQQGISGVFNGNCMITYTAYRNVFPLWALSRFIHHYTPGT